ncbi:MAG: helix-turn-helix transcriptional regulator [Planctomycetaceae bacterium]
MAKKFWDRLTNIEKDAINQGAHLLGELRDKVQQGWRERSAEGVQNLTAGPALRELREAQQISQVELAGRLDRTQSAISQIEKRGDLLLSTCTQYVEAIGGELVHFTVRFPEGDVQVAPFPAKPHDFESKAQPDS